MAKTYYSVPDRANGDTFTEAMWDDYIRTNINNLRVPPSAQLDGGGTTAGGSEEALTFSSQDHDTDSLWTSSGSAGDRFTVTTSGLYVVFIRFTPGAAVLTNLYLRSNSTSGTALAGTESPSATVFQNTDLCYLGVLPATTTVYFRVRTASAISYTASAAIAWVGAIS